MKKQLTALLLIFAMLLTMAGCSPANAAQKLDAAEDVVEEKLDAAENVVEEKLDAAEDKLEQSLRDATRPAAAPAEPLPKPTEASPAPTEAANRLSEKEALQVALDHLGFTADQVTRVRTEYEIDDGMPQFDVEFHQGDWEYEFEIHAESGKIISFDKDHKYD